MGHHNTYFPPLCVLRAAVSALLARECARLMEHGPSARRERLVLVEYLLTTVARRVNVCLNVASSVRLNSPTTFTKHERELNREPKKIDERSQAGIAADSNLHTARLTFSIKTIIFV